MGKFEDLKVWQKARSLAVKIYKITSEGLIEKDFGLKDQMRRAAVSISSNIAEGDELGTNKLAIRHFYIAKGSSAELYTQLLIAQEIGYLTNDIKEDLTDDCLAISSMLMNLIKVRKS